MTPDWLALAAEPLPVLVGAAGLLVAVAAVLWLAIEQQHARNAERYAERAYAAGLADAAWITPGAAAADEAALARHHTAAACEGLIVPPPAGLSNDPRWS